MALKHKFQSAIADSGSATLVRPSNWNDDHAFTGFPGIFCARLSVITGTAMPSADSTDGVGNLYLVPYLGSVISLYNETSGLWELFKMTAQVTLNIAGAPANTVHDVFVRSASGTLTLEIVPWTNTTTRATALAVQDGAYVKTGAPGRLYVGTIHVGATGMCDALVKRHVWNAFNRRPRILRATDATNSWTYGTSTWRQARANGANQVSVVVGLPEAALHLTLVGEAANPTEGNGVGVAIGEDSTSTPLATGQIRNFPQTIAQLFHMQAEIRKYPAVGLHTYVWLENGYSGTTFYGANSSLLGLQGTIEG